MTEQDNFSRKVGILQRVLPTYRLAFFDKLAIRCTHGVELFAGKPVPGEIIYNSTGVRTAHLCYADNLYLINGNSYHLCWQRGIVSWLRQNRPDVLIVEANPRLLSSYLAIRLMKLWKRPVIGWGLGSLDWKNSNIVKYGRNRVISNFYNRFDALIAYSKKGLSDYNKLGYPREKIFVASNSVSGEQAELMLKKIKENTDYLEQWKKDLGFSNCPVILYVGRLGPEKRVGDLIHACSRLTVPCELLIVGDGSDRKILEDLATQVFPKTRFLGHRTGEELALCFSGSDLFVLPGAGGLSIQEAMMYGKPVVVAEGDGTQEDLIREGVNGFQVPPGAIDCLANTIDRCIKDRDHLRKMGEKSRHFVEEEHNIDAMVRAFIHTLNFVTN